MVTTDEELRRAVEAFDKACVAARDYLDLA